MVNRKVAPELPEDDNDEIPSAEDLLAAELEQYRGPAQVDEDISLLDQSKLPIVDKAWFNAIIGILVFANMIYIGVELDDRKKQYYIDLENQDLSVLDMMVQRGFQWYLIENVFCLLFVAETVLRIITHGQSYFQSLMNLFDFIIVVSTFGDTYVFIWVGGSGGLRAISALRVFRLARIIQYVKRLKAFREIWLIVASFASSVRSLAWMAVFIFFFIYMCAVFLTTIVGKNDELYDVEPPSLEGPRWEHKRYFGSIPRSMFSLFQIITLDNWCDEIVRPVAEKQPIVGIFFVFYVFASSFGMINVVVGIIVENTLSTARLREIDEATVKERENSKIFNELREIFRQSDSEHNDSISLAEFSATFQSTNIRKKFQKLGLSVNDTGEIFKLMDPTNKGHIYVDEFLSSCSMLIGGASASKNVAQIAMQIDTLGRRIDMLDNELIGMETSIDNLRGTTQHFFSITLPLITGLCMD